MLASGLVAVWSNTGHDMNLWILPGGPRMRGKGFTRRERSLKRQNPFSNRVVNEKNALPQCVILKVVKFGSNSNKTWKAKS